jgi:hypothetical protein
MVLLEAEHVNLSVEEVGVQLLARSGERAVMHVLPHWNAHMTVAHVLEVVLNDCLHVAVYGEEDDGVKLV